MVFKNKQQNNKHIIFIQVGTLKYLLMKTKHSLLLIFAFIFLAGCNQNSSKPNASTYKPNYSTPPFIIDAHVHYKATDVWEKSFLDVYSARNAMGILMVRMKNLERGIQFAKAHPERIIPYAMIDIDSPTVLEDIKKVHVMGFKGLGELFATNQWNYDDSKYEPIWALAEELGMPVAPHTGIHASGRMSRMQPGYLATVGANHPNLIIHAAHFGNPWYAEAGEVARRNDKLYFDLTGSSLIKKENDPGIWEEYLWWTPHVGKKVAHMPAKSVPAFEKIIFASDEDPEALEENIRRFNKMLDANEIPEETRAKIYGLTMARLLGIEVASK